MTIDREDLHLNQSKPSNQATEDLIQLQRLQVKSSHHNKRPQHREGSNLNSYRPTHALSERKKPNSILGDTTHLAHSPTRAPARARHPGQILTTTPLPIHHPSLGSLIQVFCAGKRAADTHFEFQRFHRFHPTAARSPIIPDLTRPAPHHLGYRIK